MFFHTPNTMMPPIFMKISSFKVGVLRGGVIFSNSYSGKVLSSFPLKSYPWEVFIKKSGEGANLFWGIYRVVVRALAYAQVKIVGRERNDQMKLLDCYDTWFPRNDMLQYFEHLLVICNFHRG